jgi:hypothetical protein
MATVITTWNSVEPMEMDLGILSQPLDNALDPVFIEKFILIITKRSTKWQK